jgi:hypothetical protein
MMNSRQSKVKWSMLLAGTCFFMSAGQVCAVDAKDTVSMDGSAPLKVQSSIRISTADHSKFKVLDQEFATGPEVTKACLSCHTEAGKQFHKTYHWTWQSTGGVQKGIGKKNVLNNF